MSEKKSMKLRQLGAAIALITTSGGIYSSQALGQALEEVVVTAEKRESNAQTTAISMSVINTEQLADAGVSTVGDLTNIAPTMNIAQNNDNLMITIRGVSSRDYTESGDPAVAVSFDNFYLQDSIALNGALFDVERVEVLNGPQGTLYGRNATAGALNISSNKPNFDEFGGKLSAELGNYEHKSLEGAVNIPVSDTLAIRVAGLAKDNGGYRDNGNGLDDGDQNTTYGARVHVAWEPTDQFSSLFTYEYVDIGGVGAVAKTVLYDDVKSDGTLDFGNEKKWDLNTQNYIDVKQHNFRTKLSYDFENLSLIYSGGIQKQDYEAVKDQDGSDLQLLGWHSIAESETQNHELRVATDFSGPVNLQAGVYYYSNERDPNDAYFEIYGGDPDPLNFYIFQYEVESESKAVFSQVSYDITDTLQFEVGARYTEDEKEQTGRNDVAVGSFTYVDYGYEGNKTTWHVGANWSPLDDHFFYGKIDRGYKAGGYNNTQAYGPEEITAYEIGSKSQFLDNTLRLNTAFYYYDYTDMQVLQTNADTGVSQMFNAGEAGIFGADLGLTYLFTMQDSFDINFAYVDADYDEFCTSTGDVCPAGSDYSGNQLPQAAKVSALIGYSHDFLFGDSTLTARWQTKYQSRSYFTYFNSKAEQQEAYSKSDLTLTYNKDGFPATISGFVRNIEDRRILTMSEEAGYAGGYLVQFAAPRTFGVRVDYEF